MPDQDTAPKPGEFDSQNVLDKRGATRAMAWSMVFALISKVAFPLVGLYISRTLGPAQMGIFYIVSRIVQFSEVLRDAGLTQTYLAEPEMTARKQGSYHFVAITTGIVPMAILILIAPWLASAFRIPELAWAVPLISVVSLVNGFSTIPRAQMLRFGQIKESGLLDVVGGAIGLAIAISLVFMKAGFVAMIVQMIVAAIYGLIVATIRFPVKQIHVATSAFRDVGRKAMAVFAANGLNNIFLFSDQFVIGSMLGKFNAGIYGIASNLAYRPADLFAFPLTRTLMVAFSQTSVDKVKLGQVYGRSLAAAILVVVPIYVLLAIYASAIIHLFFGNEFPGSEVVLAALSLYLTFRVFGNISGHALVPAGKHMLTFWPWLGCLALTGGLLAWTIPMGSLMPVVWSFTAGAVFVYGTLTAMGLVHCAPGRPEWTSIGRATLSLAASSVLMILIWQLPLHEWARLAIALVAGPPAHLAIVGTFLAGNTLKYLNRNGPKALWRDL
jgi:O-antigen/teichoic acid export membrane protein